MVKEPYLYDDIPMLHFKKDTLIVVTKLANLANWCEGYLIHSDKIRLGLFPACFADPIRLRI